MLSYTTVLLLLHCCKYAFETYNDLKTDETHALTKHQIYYQIFHFWVINHFLLKHCLQKTVWQHFLWGYPLCVCGHRIFVPVLVPRLFQI